MNFTQVINYVLIFLVVISFVANFIIEITSSNLCFHISTLFYLCMLFVIANTKFNYCDRLVKVLIFYSLIWVGFRAVYLNIRYESINYSYLINFNKFDVSYSLFMTTIYTIILVLGIFVADRCIINRCVNTYLSRIRLFTIPSINFKFLCSYFITTLFLSILFNYDILEKSNKAIVIFSILFSVDCFLLIFYIEHVRNGSNKSRVHQLLFYSTCLIYLVVRVSSGSKGGLFMLFTTYIIASISYKKNFYLSKKFICSVPFIIVISCILFLVGNSIRLAKSNNLVNNVTELQATTIVDSIDFTDYTYTMDFVSRRLSMLDYLNVFFNEEPSRDYLSLEYSLKMLWNVISPAILNLEFNYKIFPANLFKASYGHGSYLEVVDNYHSDMLPMFGFLFINFGALSLLITFFIGFLFSIFFKLLILSKKKSSYLISFLFLLFYAELIFGMGFVATFQQIIFFTIFPLIIFFIIQSLFHNAYKIITS